MVGVFITDDQPVFAKKKMVTISGVVQSGTSPAVRRVLLAKPSLSDEIIGSTVSSQGDGSYSFSVVGNSNDEFRVICVGWPDENSQIFEHIKV